MMTPFDLMIVVVVFFIIIVCGYLQRERTDRFAHIANVLFVVQALYYVLILAPSVPFGYLALMQAFALWMHHVVVHFNTDFSGEITCCTLQLNDVSNHETWIVASLVAAAVYFLV